jgi:hypothetical protein
VTENAHYTFHPKITEREAAKIRFERTVLDEGTAREMRMALCPACGQRLIGLSGPGELNRQISSHRAQHAAGAVVDRPR